MAAHALARRAAAASAALASLWPALASACPYCAGRSGSTPATGVVLTCFVLLPFLISWVVYRIMRAEERAGDPTLFEVTDPDVVDRPTRPRTPGAPFLRLLPYRSRREAE